MASFTMKAGHIFPDGAVLTAYPASQFPGPQAPGPGTAPAGAAASGVNTPTVASGAATFTALADGTKYYATAVVNSVQTYVQFQTPVVAAVTVPGGARVIAGTGTPASNVVGSIGDLYLRLDGGASTTLYVKESGASTTAGWIAK